MIHYHGAPITPDPAGLRAWRGRHAFLSWAEVGLGRAPNVQQLELAASVCQSFALDNGAFTIWRHGGSAHWPDYYDWCAEWLAHPACDWAVIPDVIGGTERENDALLDSWPHGLAGVPVWHLNESIDRLAELAKVWPRIALGSAADYDVTRPRKALARLGEALPAICDDRGQPTVKLHGLRMLNPAITSVVPLASADSTTIGRNCGLDVRWKGPYAPATAETRALVIAERLEDVDTPATIDRLLLHEDPPSLFD